MSRIQQIAEYRRKTNPTAKVRYQVRKFMNWYVEDQHKMVQVGRSFETRYEAQRLADKLNSGGNKNV